MAKVKLTPFLNKESNQVQETNSKVKLTTFPGSGPVVNINPLAVKKENKEFSSYLNKDIEALEKDTQVQNELNKQASILNNLDNPTSQIRTPTALEAKEIDKATAGKTRVDLMKENLEIGTEEMIKQGKIKNITLTKPAKDFLLGLSGTVEGMVGAAEWISPNAMKPFFKEKGDQLELWQKTITPDEMDFVDKLISGAGSAATFFIPGLGVAKGASILAKVSPKLALLFGNSVATTLEAMTEAGSVYRQNQAMGESNSGMQATKTFFANAILIGLTNYAGVFSDKAKTLLKSILMSAGFEGIQEFGQSIISNVNTKQDPFEGAVESGLIGAILGGGMSAAGTFTGILPTKTKSEKDYVKKLVKVVEAQAGGNSLVDQVKKEAGVEVKPEATKPVIKEVETKREEPLVQEARKYKSAEEFVNAQLRNGGRFNISQETNVKIENGGISFWRNDSEMKPEKIGTLSDLTPATRKEFIDAKNALEKAKGTGMENTKPAGERYFKAKNTVDKELFAEEIKTKSQLTDIWNKAQEKPTTKKQAPTIKKPTTKKKVKEVKPTEKEISKSVESIISLPRKEAIQKLQESIKENGFVKGGEEVLNKVATPTLNRGIDLEVFKRKPSILNLVKENVFTDSFILINDKEVEKTNTEKLLAEIKEPTIEVKENPFISKLKENLDTQSIEEAEQALSKEYKKSLKNIEEELANIYTELEMAEAGKRYKTDEGEYVGKPSTFPEWIPEKLRSKQMLDNVIGGLYDIDNIKYPDKNKTAQRELYNFILDELDLRLNVDTKVIRSKILEKYESRAKGQVQGTINKGTRRGVQSKRGGESITKASKQKPSAKEGMRGNEREKEGNQKTIDGKEVEAERKPAEQEGLNLKPEKDAMAKKIKPAVSSEDYIKAKEEELKNKAEGLDELPMFQEFEESTKLPDIQLKREVIAKDYQGNKINLKEGDVFAVYELPKNKYFLEGKESYTVLKNVFQNIKGQSIIAEAKEFAPELEGTEESVNGYINQDERIKEIEDELARRELDEKKYIKDGQEFYKKNQEFPKTLTERVSKNADEIKKLREELRVRTIDRAEGTITKFEEYTLPNGENYREILIKAPVEKPSGMSTAKYTEKLRQGTFESSHWDEPNVLFHLRMDDRTYNGKKVSFMEEFQSDWAREGRDKGFSKNLPKGTENDIEIKFVKSNVPEGHDPKNYPGYYEAFDKRTGDFLGRGGTKPDLMERALEEINLTKGIPYNPLLKNWQTASIKRALIESVNSDYFAWTNGEQQKTRYDLSNQVDDISWNKLLEDKQITIKPIGKASIKLFVDDNGKITRSQQEDWKGKNIADVIGKGLAEKIAKKEEGELSGLDLNIGGEWANSLYDIQAKKIVEELTGGKVEMIDLGLPVEKSKETLRIGTDAFNALKKSDIKVGQEFNKGIRDSQYIITDILGDGKFKAKPIEVMGSPNSSLYEETFDISEKTTLQPALKLTPEIKAIIKGEAPQLKVEQKLYQTPSQDGKILVEALNRISTEEALAQAQDFAIVRETKIPITAVEAIKENPQALGKYVDKTIEFVYNPDVTTMPHEVGHYWFNTLLTREQQNEVLAEYKTWLDKNNRQVPDTRSSLEEALMQDMAEHYVKEYQSKSKIERFFDWIIYQIKQVLRQNNFISQFTYNVRTKTSIEKQGVFKKTDLFDAILKRESSPQYQMKLYEKVKELTEKYAKSVGEGYLPRGALGVFYRQTNNIRVSGMNNIYVAAHEIAHFLDFKYKISKELLGTTGYSINGRPIYKKETAGIRKEITQAYLRYYPGAKKTHALEKRTVEGFAVLLENYVKYPKTVEAQFPNLVKEFLKEGGKYYKPIIGEIVTDLNGIVKEYNDLSGLDKVGARIINDKVDVNKDTFLNLGERLKTEVADSIYPIEKIAKKTGRHFTIDDASLWLRQYNNATSLIMNNLTGDKGFWGWRNGEFVKLQKYNWKDLLHLLEQDSATQEFSYYLVARREYFLYEELDTLDKKSDEHRELLRVLQNDGFTREEVTEAYLNNKDRFAGFDTMYDTLVAEDLKFLNDENVQLIDKEQYDKLANQKGYASFKRAFYDEIAGDEKIEVRTFRVGKTKVSSMMKRKGSQKSIISPLFSALTNHAEITKKGLKQTVYNKIGDIAEEMPDLFQRQQLKVFPEMNGSFSYPQEKDSKIIMARKNYKRVPYLVDAQIKRTVDEILTPGNITYFEKMIIGVNRLFTKGTTGLYYGFALSNTTIDQITLAAQTRNKTIPVYDALKSLTKSLNMSNDEHRFFLEYLVSGGDRQTLIGWQNMTPNELTAKINNERNGLLKLVDLIEAGTEILATPSKYSEIATRAAEYINARKAGKPAIVSMEEAGRVTASFHHMGRFGHSQPLKTFIKSVPFFNPGIQVLSQAAETLHTKEGQKRYAFTSLAVLAASVGAMGLIVALGTDDQKDLYADISPEELMKYIWLPNPNGKSLIKVRVPDQLNIIPTLINMMWADKALLAKYKAGEYIDASMAWLPQQIQLNKPVQAFMSLIPQIIKPAFLTVAGVKDYPEIRPLESQYQKSRSPGLRFTEGTSPLAKSIGEKLNISPIKLDYLITGYFGRASGYVTGKPDIYDPFKSMKKEYYFSSGRKVQEFYDRKEVNDNLYYDMQHDLKKFTLREKNDIIKEKKQLKTINDLLKDYNDLDEEKYPKKVETIRNKIINLINKL